MHSKKNSSFIIRAAEEQDTKTILELIKELAEYENMQDMVEATEEILFDSLFVRKKAQALILEYDAHPIGYAIYFYNFSTFTGRPGIYIEDIYIKSEMRKNGFGKDVFVYLAKTAKEQNCARLEWACLDWNEPSIKFYKSMGATAMEEWTIHRLDEKSLNTLGK